MIATGFNPAVLVWAREKSGLSVAELASLIDRSPEEIGLWEQGGATPSIPQLERVADKLKRPLALFFFPQPPAENDPRGSFRTLPATELERLGAHTRLLWRRALSLQASLDELHGGANPAAPPIFRECRLSAAASPLDAARRVRAFLEVPIERQLTWRSSREAFDAWREAVQEGGVYVFKDHFKQPVVSGFCSIDDEFPVVLVNNSTAFTRQCFTLAHELCHILLGVAGVTLRDDSFINALDAEAKAIELLCNEFAGELLIPYEDLSAHLPDPTDDATIAAVAERYRVSRHVVLGRLRSRGLVTTAYFLKKCREWDADYERDKAESGGGNYYSTTTSYLGRRYVALAFSRYYQGGINIESLAGHLGVKVKNLSRLETAAL